MRNKIYQEWLNSPNVLEELKIEMKKMSPEQINLNFSDKPLSFGTAGIRAVMGPGTQLLNEFVYSQMAIGFAKFILKKYKHIKDKYVIIGHDNRKNSDLFSKICGNILTQYKINVLFFEDNKLMPTPIISYAIRRAGVCGGIIITASHNPKQYNGFKAYNHKGAQVLDDETKIIIDNMPSAKQIININFNKFDEKFISYISNNIIQEYFDDLIKNVSVNKNWIEKNKRNHKIVFTGHHGTTCELMPIFLKKLGFKNVYSVLSQSTFDPNFSGSLISNPEDPNSFKKAIELADQVGANVLIGVDPDGDRMAIAFRKTNNWYFMNGNQMGIIYSYYCLKYGTYQKPPYIISSWVSTNYIDKIANSFNAKVIRTKTGFKWMGNIMDDLNQNNSFVVAFEEAIGSLNTVINRDKDSFSAVALALEIYTEKFNFYQDLQSYLEERIYRLYAPHFTKTNSYDIKSTNWNEDAKKILQNILNFNNKKINKYKVLKVNFNKDGDCGEWILDNNSWIRFRISGTEPKFKVYYCLNDLSYSELNLTYELIDKKIIQKMIKL